MVAHMKPLLPPPKLNQPSKKPITRVARGHLPLKDAVLLIRRAAARIAKGRK